jgi:hypothetical protein
MASRKEFADEAAAVKARDKLIAEKLGKDYVETTPAAPAPGSDSVRDALEAAVASPHGPTRRNNGGGTQITCETPNRSLVGEEGTHFLSHGRVNCGCFRPGSP